MDFKQIEAFVNVAKHKSFSKAADAIYLSQPTISAHIASLEQELGIILFDRNGKDIRLTHGGSLFLEYAINLMNIRNNAITNLANYNNKIAGKLIISSSTAPCRFILPKLVTIFKESFKDVTFDIKEESTKNVVDMIIGGESEIGIVGEILKDSRLSYTKIADDNLVLVSNYPNLSEELDIEDIFDESFILREKGSATRSTFEDALNSHGYSPSRLKVFAEVSSLEAVLQFVKNGTGLSVVSELACEDYIKSGLIRKHTIKGLNMSRDIYAVIHTRRTLSPASRAFYNHITGKDEE